MSTWILWFHDHQETVGLYQWGSDQWSSLGEFPLEAIAEKVQSEPVLGFIPSERVSFVEVSLPKTSEKRLRLALPHMIEESLASPPEDNFCALPLNYRLGEANAVAVISQAYVQEKIAACHHAGISLRVLAPDCFLLPEPQDQVQKMEQGSRIIVRKSLSEGFAIAREYAPLIASELHSLPDQGPALQEPLPYNFMQGVFAPAKPRRRLNRTEWFLMVLGLACVLHLMALMILGSTLKHRLADLQTQSLDLYTQVFPGATQVSSAKSLIERELHNHGAQIDPYLVLLTTFSQILAEIPEARLDHLDYQQNRLRVDLKLPSLEAVDQLNEALKKSGTHTEQQEITEHENTILMQMILNAGDPA
jgi:type II secretory pathway component PulL